MKIHDVILIVCTAACALMGGIVGAHYATTGVEAAGFVVGALLGVVVGLLLAVAYWVSDGAP